jgi:membrane protein DedA with SNARE-associated domain
MLEFLLHHISYAGIIAVLVLTGMGLPIPEEVPIIAAGIASAQDYLDPWRAFAACVVGALLGDCMLYAIGYHFGHNLAKRHPRFAHLLHADREALIEQKIRQHGLKVFFLARFMVGIRGPVYLTAGILRMSFRRFLVVDSVCATTVVGLFFYLSYTFGDQIRKYIRRTEFVITALVVLAVVGVLIFFWRKRRRQSPAATESIESVSATVESVE